MQQKGVGADMAISSPSHTRKNDVDFPPLLHNNNTKKGFPQARIDKEKATGKEVAEEGWIVQKITCKSKENQLNEGKAHGKGSSTEIVGRCNSFAVLGNT